jgi:hypothetical protein
MRRFKYFRREKLRVMMTNLEGNNPKVGMKDKMHETESNLIF